MSDNELISLYFQSSWQWKILLPSLFLLQSLAVIIGDYFQWAYILGS